MKVLKNILKCIVLLCVMLCATYVASASGLKQAGNYTYKVLNEKEKQAAIVKIDNYKSTVKIPSDVDGYKVVQIGTDKGENVINKVDKKISTLTIPEGVTVIHKNAFYKMHSLKKINLPKSLKMIDDNNFMGAVKLKKIQFKGNINVMNNCFKNVIFDEVVANGDITVGDCCDYEIGAKIKKLILDCKKSGSYMVYVNSGFKKIDKVIAKRNVKTLSIFSGYFDKIALENSDARLSINFNQVTIDKASVGLKQPVKQKDGTYNYDWSHINFKPTYALDERKVDVSYKIYEKRAGRNNKLIKNVKESGVSLKQKKSYIVEAIYSYKDI